MAVAVADGMAALRAWLSEVVVMVTLTIRDVGDATHERLCARAASHGRSVEAEIRSILVAAVDAPPPNLLLELRQRVGEDGIDLPRPARTDAPHVAPLP